METHRSARRRRQKLTIKEIRELESLPELRYWLAAMHYNEVVNMQDMIFQKEAKALRAVVLTQEAPVSSKPADPERRVPYHSGGREDVRWDATAVACVALLAMLLVIIKLICHPDVQHRLKKIRQGQPCGSQASYEEEDLPMTDPSFPPPYTHMPQLEAAFGVEGAASSDGTYRSIVQYIPLPNDYPPPPYTETTQNPTVFYQNVEIHHAPGNMADAVSTHELSRQNSLNREQNVTV